MKRYISPIIFGLGWILLGIYLISGHYINGLSTNKSAFSFSPVAWEYHLQLFEGALQCNLTDEDLLKRKMFLKDKIFLNVVKKEKSRNGFVYYFNDEEFLLDYVLEFVQKEKACCPFFKFDISILPFNKGFALQISGSEEAVKILKNFESNSF